MEQRWGHLSQSTLPFSRLSVLLSDNLGRLAILQYTTEPPEKQARSADIDASLSFIHSWSSELIHKSPKHHDFIKQKNVNAVNHKKNLDLMC